MDTPAPTIAVVDGAVRAGGIGLMAACDLVVVNEATTFALTEVRIGVAAAIISVPILQRVPPGKIAAAMLTGEQFDAEEARSMGLVTHVCDDTRAVVSTLCAGILKGAPLAVAATKELLHSVPGRDRNEAFESMRVLSETFFSSPDAAEGMQAFAEKREPVWERR
jgi:enoyl-CoA hydratase